MTTTPRWPTARGWSVDDGAGPPGWWSGSGGVEEPDPQATQVVHLVLLDGRLVDSWSEPVDGTRWQRFVPRRARPVVQLPRDEDEDMLAWLAAVCGSREALDALTDRPLSDHLTVDRRQDGAGRVRTGEGSPPSVRGREPDELDDLLERAAAVLDDGEARVAMRRAAELMRRDAALLASLTPQQRAAGVAWVVAKANGLFGPRASQSAVQHALGLASAITAPGRAVERALVGPLTLDVARPRAAPELLVLGRTDLLVGATRRALIGWRDRALAAQRAAAGRHPCTACAPPAEPGS